MHKLSLEEKNVVETAIEILMESFSPPHAVILMQEWAMIGILTMAAEAGKDYEDVVPMLIKSYEGKAKQAWEIVKRMNNVH